MSATAVLLLHAFPFDSRMWRAEVDAVKTKRLVLAPDLRGFGLRGFGAARGMPPPESVDQHARDLVGLLDAAGVARALVVGLSMGGYVALALHRLAAHRVAGLLLADTNAHADSVEAKAERDALAARIAREGLGFLPDVLLPRLVAGGCSDAVRQSLRRMMLEQEPRAVVAALRALRNRPDHTKRLAAIRVPTTVVCGAADVLSTPETMEGMARAIPGARMRVLRGVGHLTNLEAPEAFRLVLGEALAVVDAR